MSQPEPFPANPPVLDIVTNQIANVGVGLIISNTVNGTAVGSFIYSLGRAPFGASISPSNGVFRWTPGCSQGSTTNQITVLVTDSDRTNIGDAMSFTIVVTECVAPQLGRLVLRSGDTGRLPIDLITSVPLTNLVTLVSASMNRFVHFDVEAIATQICFATIAATNAPPLPQGGEGEAGEGGRELHIITLGTCANQSLSGTQQVAWLVLTAVTNQHSAFVPVEIGPSIATQPDGTFVTNYVTQAGRVVIVGEESLLEALHSTNSQVQLILYAPVGTTNQIVASSQLAWPGAWTLWQQLAPEPVPNAAALHPHQPGGLFPRGAAVMRRG